LTLALLSCQKSEQTTSQLAEEAKLAAHFNVPKGWRHYREAGDADDGWQRHFTAGSDIGVTPEKFMIIEGAIFGELFAAGGDEVLSSGVKGGCWGLPEFWVEV